MFLSKPLGMLLCCGTILPSTGCVVEAGEAYEPNPTGYLTLRWSIENSHSSAMCKLFGAERLELLVYDPRQRQVGEFYRDCDDFEMAVPLFEGAYSANATLVDGWARAVSTTVPISGIRIPAGEAVVVRIDFPAESKRE
jgi:hypothetical protein